MCRCGRSNEESDKARREETDRIILEFAKKHPELVRQNAVDELIPFIDAEARRKEHQQ